ncbi:GMP synthase [glutamine-hydrolyzing] [Maioricimonas rarisocia]|uniref:GMP synthase [glutamine-hydrolyzing] n=2 Tax=Maioricimonas rarisocia TaxID=2528026 RepID=A0A517ZA73_9PLAN|nr:GMP synthase [glutamine-hydrolyzing] [Maioricimonas rarisocia]
MPPGLRYLLLQVRNPDDPMREHEVTCFARVLRAEVGQIEVFDLLGGPLTPEHLRDIDVVLLGGSGHYSVTDQGPWLDQALDSLRVLHAERKPTFASCWGFQAMARAMGGHVVKDLNRAELGTHRLFRTEAARTDPVFAAIPDAFNGQMGHEDLVVELPPNATLLASSERVENQAYRLNDAPVYCTQFHPELNCADLLQRIQTYPEYMERITGLPLEEFHQMIRESKPSEEILRQFVRWSMADREATGDLGPPLAAGDDVS